MVSSRQRISVLLLAGLGLACKADGPTSEQPVKPEVTKLPSARPDELEDFSAVERVRRKAATGEAIVAIAKIMDATSNDKHGEFGLCSVTPNGSIGPTPPLAVDCTKGPEKQCSPVDPPRKPERPWEYSSAAWDVSEWETAEFRQFIDHRYHYSLEWRLLEQGEGLDRCEILARAIGDVDGDGVFARFERKNTAYNASEDPSDLVYKRIENEFE